MRSSRRLILATFSGALLAAAPAAGAQAPTRDIVAALSAQGGFNTFVTALNAANLTSTLEGAAGFTVFAPTDAAFARLAPGQLDSLLADTAALKRVLLYHIVPGKINGNKLLRLTDARTLSGSKIKLMYRDRRVNVNDAAVIVPNLFATNGIIHGINAVLMPPPK